MPEPIFYLTEADHALLKEMANAHRRRPGTLRTRESLDIPQAPDVYVARTPTGGIPALTDVVGTTTDDPGSAVCQVYQITDGTTPETGTGTEGAGDANLEVVSEFTLRVYNLSGELIPGGIWVVVGRDKFGRWACLTDLPMVYVARAPSGGIPALSLGTDLGTGSGSAATSDDTPGSASCKIYQLSGSHLYRTGFSRTVYNLSTSDIPAGDWVIINQDRYGYWYVAAGSSGGAAVNVDYVRVINTTANGSFYPAYLQEISTFGNATDSERHVESAPSSTDTGADTVTMTFTAVQTAWATGQIVIVQTTGGGLTAGTVYYLRLVSSNTYSFHTTAADAAAGTNKVNLTASITAIVEEVNVWAIFNSGTSVTPDITTPYGGKRTGTWIDGLPIYLVFHPLTSGGSVTDTGDWVVVQSNVVKHLEPYTSNTVANISQLHSFAGWGSCCGMVMDDAGHVLGYYRDDATWFSPWGFSDPGLATTDS